MKLTKDQLPSLIKMLESKDFKDKELLIGILGECEPCEIGRDILIRIIKRKEFSRTRPRDIIEILTYNHLLEVAKIYLQFEKELHQEFKMQIS